VSHITSCGLIVSATLALLAGAHLFAEDISLVDQADPAKGWSFGNGPEFPGAKGSLDLDASTTHAGHPALHLVSDLSGGGNYVQMGRDVRALHLSLDTLSFWIKAPGLTGMAMRLIDGTGQ